MKRYTTALDLLKLCWTACAENANLYSPYKKVISDIRYLDTGMYSRKNRFTAEELTTDSSFSSRYKRND